MGESPPGCSRALTRNRVKYTGLETQGDPLAFRTGQIVDSHEGGMQVVPHIRHSVNRSHRWYDCGVQINEDHMDRYDALYQPVLDEIERRSLVSDQVLDKDVYRIYLATFWVNAVTDPGEAGIEEYELELLHDYLNERIPEVLGTDSTIRDCFKFVASRDGEETMQRLRVRGMHRDLLMFFCSMILNPEAHERWTEAQRKKQ